MSLKTNGSDSDIGIERLKNLLKRREAQLAHAYDWRYEKEIELQELKQQLAELKTELGRVIEGDNSPQ